MPSEGEPQAMSQDQVSPGLIGWALKRVDGSVVVELGHDIDEARIWQVGLGWPHAEEIEWNKRRGARAFRCRLTEVIEP